MKWNSKYFFSISLMLFITFFINQKIFAINEWFEDYNNTRSLAMGGAAIALTSDETSLYRNPANLGSVRSFFGTVFDPELEGSNHFTSQVSSQSTSKAFEVSEIMSVLGSHLDTYYHAKAQLTPSLVARNFGVGLIYRNEVSAQMDSTGQFLDIKKYNDVGFIMGLNFRLFDGRLKIGGSVKSFNRIEVVNTALSVTGPTDAESISAEGTAFAFDGGLLLQAPWTYIPTLGVVVKDIGGTKFDKDDGLRLNTAHRPQTVSQSVDAAISIFPIHGNQLRSLWTFEYRDITNSRNDTDSAKRIHAGIELNARDIFFFRIGYNQRYWTAGFEIAGEYAMWQIAYYGEEVGTAANPKEDQRLNTKISLRF